MKKTSRELMKIYHTLLAAFGPRHWWPGDTPLEIIIGAILTQNTAWKNVEKAIGNLKNNKLLDFNKLRTVSEKRLADLVRPSGYYNQKAKKLKVFTDFLVKNYNGSLRKMGAQDLRPLREQLLSIFGIGEETADSILLYAFNKPIFVVDAYTRRFLVRHGFIPERSTYQQIQQFFMQHLSKDVPLYNEYHALIVYLGKDFCRTKPRCGECPLNHKKFYSR